MSDRGTKGYTGSQKRLLTFEELCEALQLSRNTILNYIKKGLIKNYVRPNRKIFRFDLEEVLEDLKRNTYIPKSWLDKVEEDPLE